MKAPQFLLFFTFSSFFTLAALAESIAPSSVDALGVSIDSMSTKIMLVTGVQACKNEDLRSNNFELYIESCAGDLTFFSEDTLTEVSIIALQEQLQDLHHLSNERLANQLLSILVSKNRTHISFTVQDFKEALAKYTPATDAEILKHEEGILQIENLFN